MPEVLEKHGDYRTMFSTVFGLAAKDLDITLTWDFFDVVEAQAYPSLEAIGNRTYDAIVLTGSKYNAHDNTPWIVKLMDFLKTVRVEYHQRVRLVGICFGHQILLRALGGMTGRNEKGWERINQFHQDHVSKLPDGFQTLAFTENNTPHHATVSDDRQCITVQGHPELNKDAVKIMVEKRKEAGIVPAQVADKALEALKLNGLNMEDVWLCKKFLQFIITLNK
ncbi:hypothetical protein RO3G_03514 [Rhizopus delemar RA 99-880]|uniref:Uncharacterized protein n=1 Tax=Rhizopus delemar (strain RA 99-880 / ATCC MYA-4621 / FGSC 9543 / NRRL 43880) TaxID=246409 RepID=I1BRH9_RHIO9|nr:hypothetical protein RO3G_03514 [Rhizopus delemar RA 99-880]|eukprot:EIE78809.1 hypothetical protein RO3G_03514 [Rhizopus delemar RA 99-880]